MTYSICFSPVGVDDFSQQLNKLRWSNKSHLHWVYGGLAVSRGTLFYAASRLAMCFTWNLGRGAWVVGGMVFENCFPPIVAEELVFHVKPENSRKFFLTVGGMRFDFSVGHNTWLLFSNSFSVGVFAWCVFLWVGFTVGVLCCGWSGGFIEWVVVFHVKHSAELSVD